MNTACNQRTGRSGLHMLAALVLAGWAGLAAAQSASYDFEGLILGQLLAGQDGWQSAPDLGEVLIRQDASAGNGTRVAETVLHLASGWPALLTRGNDLAFGYSPWFGSETQAVMQFDANGEATTAFALGTDLDGDGQVDYADGELGPAFGTLRDWHHEGVEQFMVATATLGSFYLAGLNEGGRCCNHDGDWYRLQLRMDLSANAGAGAGSLYYMNLSRGDIRFQPVAELQDLDLGLGAMHPEAGPEHWDAIWLGMLFDGSHNMPRADNLLPRLPAVLGADFSLSLQGVDAQALFGANFDAELRPQYMPAAPPGLYWGLDQVAHSHPVAASAGQLLANFDLILDEVDIYALFPELGTLENVCLRYQGELGEPPRMSWRYDPSGCE